MARSDERQVFGAQASSPLISTDVFDTLLLRTWRSERSRIVEAERRFSAVLRQQGIEVSTAHLARVRLLAQRLAFRALNTSGNPGEVRLTDLIERQLRLLGIDTSYAAVRQRIELDVEKQSLCPNNALARHLRSERETGRRIVAISDTTLSGDAVRHLIEHFHGHDLVDRVYASADLNLTKKQGGLFAAVSNAEDVGFPDMQHFGDDAHADVKIPERQGMRAKWVRRGRHHGYARKVNGAWTALRQAIGHRRSGIPGATRPVDPQGFGREVFGPIVTQFAIRIWLYAAEAARTGRPVLLFCARGGLGIREVFERVLGRLGLPLELPRQNLMVSRLIAARAAILRGSPAVLDELERDFRGRSMASVAGSIGGGPYQLSEAWQRPFHGQGFLKMLGSGEGAAVLADIETQSSYFRRHLADLAGDADRLILCDTGLYGSTQKLLADGLPDRRFETVQFARSNYKGHDEAHFDRVVGLVVERGRYHPLDSASTVLRYWHVIESLFEPRLPSVRRFSEAGDGRIEGNCGTTAFGALGPDLFSPMLVGAMQYIESLPRRGGTQKALADGDVAWRRLKNAILRPDAIDLQILSIGSRSIDFGRSEMVDVVSSKVQPDYLGRIRSVKGQLWREGAISQAFPLLKHALLPAMSAVYLYRALRGRRVRQAGDGPRCPAACGIRTRLWLGRQSGRPWSRLR